MVHLSGSLHEQKYILVWSAGGRFLVLVGHVDKVNEVLTLTDGFPSLGLCLPLRCAVHWAVVCALRDVKMRMSLYETQHVTPASIVTETLSVCLGNGWRE